MHYSIILTVAFKHWRTEDYKKTAKLLPGGLITLHFALCSVKNQLVVTVEWLNMFSLAPVLGVTAVLLMTELSAGRTIDDLPLQILQGSKKVIFFFI